GVGQAERRAVQHQAWRAEKAGLVLAGAEAAGQGGGEDPGACRGAPGKAGQQQDHAADLTPWPIAGNPTGKPHLNPRVWAERSKKRATPWMAICSFSAKGLGDRRGPAV